MRIDIATLFPEMCETVLNESILGRARRAGYIEFACHNIRGYTTDRHGRVDDYGYGGGKGMVMQPEPIQRCFTDVCAKLGKKPHVIYMSPQGRVLTQQRCMELSRMDNLFILCGHYEGVDERVLTEMVDEEISIGDYVLTGGELPALVLADAVARMCGGVLAASECYEEESHMGGGLVPQYTRPESGVVSVCLIFFYPDITKRLRNGGSYSGSSAREKSVLIFMKSTPWSKRDKTA